MGQYHQLSDTLLELAIVLEFVLLRYIFMVVLEAICLCLDLHKFVCLSAGTAVHHSSTLWQGSALREATC